LTFLPDEPVFALAVLAGVLLRAEGLAALAGAVLATPAFVAGALFAAAGLAFLAGAAFAAPAFLAAVVSFEAVVFCFALVGIVVLRADGWD